MALMRLARPVVSLVVTAGLACTGPRGEAALEVRLDPAGASQGIVEVHGLTRPLRRALARLSPDHPDWPRVLTVQVNSDGAETPAVAGRYAMDGEVLRFTPRFPPEGALTYRVRLDPAELRRLAGVGPGSDTVQRWSFAVPARPIPAPSTRVLAVHPSAPLIPANQLRWYIEFSAPMREGESLQAVQLVDDRGRVVEGAFLPRDEELWNPERTRLTLLFDMARVKHAIRRRLEVGPVLEPGRQYTLRIASSWHDARGATLAEGFSHHFRAGPDDAEAVSPGGWRVLRPAIGSRQPLVIEFGEPLDHALAASLIAVTGPAEEPLAGEVRLSHNDQRWEFVPAAPWLAEGYAIRVSAALEDLAGNRVDRPFDANISRGQSAGVEPQPRVLPFLPVGETASR